MVKEQELQPEQMRKLFIGGLDYRTTDESLKEYFEQYGEIVDVVVMKDPKTKRSRGFGFVAFSQAYMVDEAQKHRPHKIDGRSVDTKRAVPRDEIGKPESGVTVKKLFVGGIKDDVDEEDLREVFGEFGTVTAVSIPTEKESQKKRGFAFVEFEDYDAVDKACLNKNIMIKNKRVDVKKALSRNELAMQQNRGGGRGGMGGRGNDNGPWQRGGNQGGNWGGNQGGGWGDNRGGYNQGWGNQGNQGYNSGPGNYGGNQGPWQGGQNNQGGWGGNQQGGNQWGGPQGGYGGGQGGNNWGQGDFGNNYGQSYGGGPMRNQGGYGGNTNRPSPYNSGGETAGGGAPGGYNQGPNSGYGGGSNMGAQGGPGRRY